MPMIITNPRLPDNPIVFANDAFCNLSGYSREEVIGRNPRMLQGPQSDLAAIARIRAAVAAREPIEIEVCNHRRNGEPFWNRLLITPIFGKDGNLEYFFGNQIDIAMERQRRAELQAHHAELTAYAKCLAARTRELAAANERLRVEAEERALVEASLRHAHKMEAVGCLAGGIAHDFNNLLMVIIGGLELVQRRVAERRYDGVERLTSAAMTSAQRGSDLIRRLLDFARRQPLAPAEVDAKALMLSMEDLLRRTLGPMVTLELSTASAVWPALCDPNQLENAVLNLAINARDAMPDGGRLIVVTSNAGPGDTLAPGGALPPGDYVAIKVTDTGTGMQPDVIARATEPFFTTKPNGKGTGLGLSMVFGFVRQSGGDLHIRSDPGRGTTFTLYLPRHRGDAAFPTAT
jgi:PAS domain S-box-containing protein